MDGLVQCVHKENACYASGMLMHSLRHLHAMHGLKIAGNLATVGSFLLRTSPCFLEAAGLFLHRRAEDKYPLMRSQR